VVRAILVRRSVAGLRVAEMIPLGQTYVVDLDKQMQLETCECSLEPDTRPCQNYRHYARAIWARRENEPDQPEFWGWVPYDCLKIDMRLM